MLAHENRKQEKKKMIPFRESLHGSIRPFPGLAEFLLAGAVTRKPPKTGACPHGQTLNNIQCLWACRHKSDLKINIQKNKTNLERPHLFNFIF